MAKKRSGLGDRRNRRDHYHRQAQSQGYRARSVFKLEEIDARVRLLAPGNRVLDLGCAPGSWLQYAAQKVGEHGHLVGIDRFPLDFTLPNLRMVVGDIFDVSAADLVGDLRAFDVVLSDMAPDTTGIRHVNQARSEVLFERALEIALETLAPAGHFAAKIFMGSGFAELLKRCRQHFDQVKVIKPASSRAESIEQYVVAHGLLP